METSAQQEQQQPAAAKIRNLPWVEKYRPQTLNDLISHQDILSTIQKFISEDRLPHLLLYGPPGTGKTSTILACAKQLYKDKEFGSMVLELNASDDRGIDIVRGPILSFASTRTIFKKGFKLVILDEADAMTQDAQNALRRGKKSSQISLKIRASPDGTFKSDQTLVSHPPLPRGSIWGWEFVFSGCQRPFCRDASSLFGPEGKVLRRYLLCTRLPRQWPPELLLSERGRPCLAAQRAKPLAHLVLGAWSWIPDPPPAVDAESPANSIPPLSCYWKPSFWGASRSRVNAGALGPLNSSCRFPFRVDLSEDGMKALVTLSSGDMRRALNILQSTNMAFGKVTEETVYTCTGHPLKSDIANILDWMLNQDFTTAYRNIMELKTLKGLALHDILTEIHLFVHRVDFPSSVRVHLLTKMADIEYRLSVGTNEKIQLSSLIAAFQVTRDLIVTEA
nr:replication factor C subunit 5 [Vulpes vulpes]